MGPPTPKELERRTKTTTELIEIGKIGELTVYDLWYTRGVYSEGHRDLRSILIQTGPDEFREFDVHDFFTAYNLYLPSEIVVLDGDPLLIVEYHDGGNNNHIYKTPYFFRENGPEKADFSAVAKAIKALIPPYMSVRGSEDDYASMQSIVELYRNDTHEALVSVKERARVTITYRFFDGHAVVTGNTYQPYFN